MKILFVDDDDHVRWTIETILTSLGHQVSAFGLPHEAFGYLCTHPNQFDCLLLDRNMPGMDGLQLMERIRAETSLAQIPVVMLTSSSEPEEVAEGLAGGAHLYLTKPAPRKLLRAALNQIEAYLDEKREIALNLQEARGGLDLLTRAELQLQTVSEARRVAALLAAMTHDPDNTVVGFTELLINGIEHGNLGITYKDKSRLLEDDELQDEINQRLASDEYKDKYVRAYIERTAKGLKVRIEDEGEGFDWRPFMEFSPERAFDLHGRGIAISNQIAFGRLEYQGKGNIVEVFLDNLSSTEDASLPDTTAPSAPAAGNSPEAACTRL